MKPVNLFMTASAVILTASVLVPVTLAIAGEPDVRRVVVTPGDDNGKKTCEMRVTIMQGPAFADIDSDHNGSLSPAEFDAFHADHHPGGMDHGPGGDMHGPPPPEGCGDVKMQWTGGGPDGPGMEKRRVFIMQRGDIDTDKDGKITFEEFAAPMKKHFEELDANHDGSLGSDELKSDLPPPPPGG